MEIINWLNANDGAIIGIATLVLVSITICYTYKDTANRKYERSFSLDFAEGVGFSQVGRPPLYDIVKVTKEIQKDLQRIATGSYKPMVLTEPLSEHRRGQFASSLEIRIEQFSSELQQEILREIDLIVSKREQETRDKEQNEKTTMDTNAS